MQEAELPEREAERIEALRECEILDTLPEQAYDDITYLASRLCETPIALVSLVDAERQWFKSRVGLDVSETPRALAFCAHAILEPENLFVVPDTEDDARFADNPLVTHAPKVRFYAGSPLVTSDGHPLGTLCVLDRKPRELSASQEESLRALSRQVVAHLELRRTVGKLEITTRRLAEANDALERRHAQVEKSRSELAELCRLLEGQAEIIDRDLQRAEVIQRSLLPSEAPRVRDFSVQTLYQPGQSVGGDLYDFVGIGDHTVALLIADAAGHGVSAAMLSVLFKQRLRLVEADDATPRRPAAVLEELNRSLIADVSAPGVFVTAVIGLLDTRAGRLWLSSAGHPPALVLRADGASERWEHTGPALGLYPEAVYAEHEIALQPGDRLLLYTDGIFDGAADEAAVLRRLATRLHALRDEKNPLEPLLDEIGASPERADRDDVTILLVEPRSRGSHFLEAKREGAAAREVGAELEPEPEAARIDYGETPAGTYLALRGRVNWMHGSRLLGAAVASIEAKRALDLDLASCDHLDSTLLGTLHEIVERADSAGVALRIGAPNAQVRAAFEELSLEDVLDHVTDVAPAVPGQTTPLAAPASDPRIQRLRLLKAHEVLAELSDENRADLAAVVEALRSDLASR